MILVPTSRGKVALYQPLDAQAYLGCSANTLARWRREGWLEGTAVGRGFVYTKDALDECRKLRNLNVRNKEGEYA